MTITESLTFGTTVCCACGVAFAMPNDLKQNRIDYGQDFYCPNGHKLNFKKCQVEILREQLESKEKELRTAKCETLNQQHLRETAEGKLKRIEKRVKHGVCPCCHRTVKQLAAHMKSKHPEWKAQ